MIKAVLFDVDGVLLDSFDANLKFYQDLMAHFGYPPPTREQYRSLFQYSLKEVIRRLTGLTNESEIEKIWETGKERLVPYDTSLLKIPAGVHDVLASLRASYSLGIVTSRIKMSVFEVPALKKMKEYFQVVASYNDTTKHKPDPEPLYFALRGLGVVAKEAVYVGDAEVDEKAALAAGVPFIAFGNPALTAAQAHATSFADLPPLISMIARNR